MAAHLAEERRVVVGRSALLKGVLGEAVLVVEQRAVDLPPASPIVRRQGVAAKRRP